MRQTPWLSITRRLCSERWSPRSGSTYPAKSHDTDRHRFHEVLHGSDDLSPVCQSLHIPSIVASYHVMAYEMGRSASGASLRIASHLPQLNELSALARMASRRDHPKDPAHIFSAHESSHRSGSPDFASVRRTAIHSISSFSCGIISGSSSVTP
jgi:hypothetical protein